MPNPKTIGFWRGRLPHWEVEDGKYFVTVHLKGAIPRAGRTQIRQIAEELRALTRHCRSEAVMLQRRLFNEMEAWLDGCEWAAHFRNRDIAEMVVEAIENRRNRRLWNVFEYVVMPTHIHLFFETSDGHIKNVMEDFKRWTGHQAGKLMDLAGGRFWQVEWFDHWSRSDEESERIVTYIRKNPEKAGLAKRYIDWKFGSWSAGSL